jgi:parallel beta-helix repeat protein
MAFIFPARTVASTAQQHLDDHNLLASLLDRAGGYTLSSTPAQHLAEHNAIHTPFGLAQRTLDDTAATHLSDHTTMHTNIVTVYAGIRGVWGQQASTGDVPNWPVAFDTSTNNFTTLQNAVNAAGTGRKFEITGNITFTAALLPHASDEFWIDPGATVSGAGIQAFSDNGLATPSGVKIMNGTFSGFTNVVRNTAAAGWEVAYCDFASATSQCIYVHGSLATPQIWLHHSKFHDTGNPIEMGHTSVQARLDQGTDGPLIEDCEFTALTGSDAFKIGVGSVGAIVRHCWSHDFAGRGFWFDYDNFDNVIEWCLIEDHTGADGMGIEFEANRGTHGNLFGDTDPQGPGNIARYNYIRNNDHVGISIQGSSDMQIYGNYFYRNQPVNQTGIADGEIQLYVNGHHTGPASAGHQRSDLAGNLIHNNYIEITPTIGGHGAKRGVGLVVTVDASYLPSETPYVSNTKGNDFSADDYKLNRVASSSDLFYWDEGGAGNKTWAQWQAIPQDADGSAVE